MFKNSIVQNLKNFLYFQQFKKRSVLKKYKSSNILQNKCINKAYQQYFTTDKIIQDGKLEILNNLQQINGQNLVSQGLIYSTDVDNKGNVEIKLKLDKNYLSIKNAIKEQMKSIPWIVDLKIKIAPSDFEEQNVQKEKSQKALRRGGLSKVKKIIAVSSCKGGVGKSTVAVNLAFSLLKQGKQVGIFDADIYGPSLPTMLNKENEQAYTQKDNSQSIIPIEYEGMKAMSYGFVTKNKAIMRGAMVSQLVSQLLYTTNWGDLDYLVLDMPPGTGDIQLTICQESSLDAAVIVTTPQRLSFVDVIKGIEMFDILKVPTVAIIENMSSFICDDCSTEHQIFGIGYLDMLKKQFGIQNSFGIPLMTKLASLSDNGLPAVLTLPNSHTITKIYDQIATQVQQEIVNVEKVQPPIVVYDQVSKNIILSDQNNKSIVKTIKSFQLRKSCQCAACIDEFTGKKLIDEKNIDDNVHPTHIDPKGNYAVGIVWSDGHRSSIYPYSIILSDQIPSV